MTIPPLPLIWCDWFVFSWVAPISSCLSFFVLRGVISESSQKYCTTNMTLSPPKNCPQKHPSWSNLFTLLLLYALCGVAYKGSQGLSRKYAVCVSITYLFSEQFIYSRFWERVPLFRLVHRSEWFWFAIICPLVCRSFYVIRSIFQKMLLTITKFEGTLCATFFNDFGLQSSASTGS